MEFSVLSIWEHSNLITDPICRGKNLFQVNFPQIGLIFQFAIKCDKS